MTSYRNWRQRGSLSPSGRCFDVGNTVSAAMRRFILSQITDNLARLGGA